jgi:putative RecB family exonuclease
MLYRKEGPRTKRKKIYSHSKLSTFEQCPKKFKYRYIDKIIPEIEKTIEAHLGSAVHNTLEWLYFKVKQGSLPTLDDTILRYSEQWQKEYSPEIVIVKDKLTAKDYFNKGVQFLVDYYMKHQPFDDGTLEIEKKITISITDEHDIIGFIDRFVKNPITNEFEIHDYKTANSLPSQDKIDSDRQLALYAIAIKEAYGRDQEVILIWHYLAHNKKIQSKRTNQQLEELKQETIDLIRKIESAREFPHNKSTLCDWCEYKQMCPAWNTSEDKEKEIEKKEQLKNIKVDKDKYPTISKYIKD